MYRYLLASAATFALAAPAAATTTISTPRTTPVKTSTVANGSPDAIKIAEAGSVTVGSGAAVTVDSNHGVENAGKIVLGDANGATGILVETGTTGDIVNTGKITLDEAYTPVDSDNDGDKDGPFAQGSNRFGIRIDGPHTGKVVNDGEIYVEGNNSAGIWLGGALTGNFRHDGKTEVIGNDSTGVRTGDVNGDVRLAGTVSARGANAVAARFDGDITGALVVQGTIVSTGYRTPAPTGDTSKYDADDLLQGGPALIVGGDVAGGIVLAKRPADADPNDADEDDDGIADDKEGTAKVESYGAAPAMVIGSANSDVAVGAIAGQADGYGLVIEGEVNGKGVYANVDANGLVIGGLGHAVDIAGGMQVSGTVSAGSSGANATALRIGGGASVPEIAVSGTVTATGGGDTGDVTRAILVDTGATVTEIANSGTISATITKKDGSAIAIADRTGGVTLVTNTGKINAAGAQAGSNRNIAIDLSANTTGATVLQKSAGEGKAMPTLFGNVLFGSGDDTFRIEYGYARGNVGFGAGDDRFELDGGGRFYGLADFGGGMDVLTLDDEAVFSGAFANAANLAVTVNASTLDVYKPATIASLALDKDSTLKVMLDKDAGEGTHFTVSGTASFAEGATIAVRLSDTANAEGRYIVLDAGTLVGLAGIETDTDLVPFMFKAELADDAGPNRIAIDVARRTATELGLNASRAAAYDAVFEALANDEDIEQVFLGIDDEDVFGATVGMMLPDHAGGAFQSVSLGSRAFARQVADPHGSVYEAGPLNFILNAASWSVDKDELGDSATYDLGGHGLSGSIEIDTMIGYFGASAAWLWNGYDGANELSRVTSDTFEFAGYWRGEWGGFAAYARGSYGFANFSGRRNFVGDDDGELVQRSATGEWDGTLTTFSGGASYEFGGDYIFVRPVVGVEYVSLDEDGYSETGGKDEGYALVVEERSSDELAITGGLAAGIDFVGNGRRDSNWFRMEGEAGWREIAGGKLGSTTAHFEDGDDFTIAPDQNESGWYARLRAMGGMRQFELGGEVGAEKSIDGVAMSLRGTLRFGF